VHLVGFYYKNNFTVPDFMRSAGVPVASKGTCCQGI